MCGAKAQLIRQPDVYQCRCGELFIGEAERVRPLPDGRLSDGFVNAVVFAVVIVATFIALWLVRPT